MLKSNVYDVVLDRTRQTKLLLVREHEKIRANSPENLVYAANDVLYLKDRAEEVAVLVALDNKCNVKGLFEVSKGTVNASMLHPREIFVRLCMVGASSFAVLHNHPSGDPTPSMEDKDACKRLKEAGELMGIKLTDFIVVGDGTYISFADQRIL